MKAIEPICPDGIAGELLKYGDTVLHGEMAQILNQMFENCEVELGRGTIIFLKKPGKPLGQLNSLKPLLRLLAFLNNDQRI